MMRGWPFSNFPNTSFTINRESPQARGLVGWWPMLGAPGANYLRDRVAGNDAAAANSPGWAADRTMGWATTHNTSAYWEAPATTRLDLTGPFTVSIWAMLDPARVNGTIYGMFSRTNSNWVAASIQWFLSRGAWSTVFKFTVSDGNEPEVGANSPAITLGKLHHVVGRFDGTNISCWLDGVSGTPAAASTQSLSSTVAIGALQSGAIPWYGTLADARVYNCALSPAVIWQMAHDKKWDLYRPLRRWWALRAPSGWRRHISLTGVGTELS